MRRNRNPVTQWLSAVLKEWPILKGTKHFPMRCVQVHLWSVGESRETALLTWPRVLCRILLLCLCIYCHSMSSRQLFNLHNTWTYFKLLNKILNLLAYSGDSLAVPGHDQWEKPGEKGREPALGVQTRKVVGLDLGPCSKSESKIQRLSGSCLKRTPWWHRQNCRRHTSCI